MSAKSISARIENLKDKAAHLSDRAFREAAAACGVIFIDERLGSEDETDILLHAMEGLSQAQIAEVASAVEIVAADTRVAFADKEPKINGPAVNCEKPVSLRLPGPWIDQSKRGWENKWRASAISIRNTLIGLGKAECATADCPGTGECSFLVDSDGGIEYGTETDADNRTTRIRAVVTIKGKCVCPKRPTTGGGS